MIRALSIVALLSACSGPGTLTVAAPVPDPGPGPGEPMPPDVIVPAPDPAPVTDGDVTEAWVNGMQIIVKRNPGVDMTAAGLFIRGGVRNWGKADAGLEQLAIRTAVSGGTERLDKDTYTRRLSELGSTVGGGSNNDYAVISAWSLTPAWDETFDLMVDAFLHPALPASQLELVRAQQLSGLKREQEEPDSRLGLMVHLGMFRGHPYEHRAIGTLETVSGFTVDQVRAHLAKLRETSRLLLVVVGDVDASHVIEQARAALGGLPRGSYADTPLPGWSVDKPEVTIVEDKLPTNYIQAVFPGPGWRDPEYAVAMVAMSTLRYREFEEVRTKRNLSYAPSAFFAAGSGVPFGGLYVTAVDPVATMAVMLGEAKRLRDEPIPAKDLTGTKSMLLTNTVASAEAPSDQGWELAQAQLLGGDWRMVRTLPDRIRAVTSEQVQSWAAKHLTRLRVFVIGDKTKIDQQALEAF